MNVFSMWESQIIFKNGWFIYMDGKGHNSIISYKRARELEEGFQRYQASMDVNRGGMPDEMAYPGRGFVLKDGKYVYENYRVDKFIDDEIAPITSVLVIPESVGGILINYIADRAFSYETIIEKVVLHGNIGEIGESAFEGCNHLDEILGQNGQMLIKVNAFKDTGIFKAEGATYINHTLTRVHPNCSGVFEVKRGTTTIADEAFKDCELITEVALPEELRIIGNGCFTNCTKLQNISFPSRMDDIGASAFAGCVALQRISLPEGIDEIPSGIFHKCVSLLEIHIPQSVKNIRRDAFKECGIMAQYEEGSQEELYIGHWLIDYKWKEKETLIVREGTTGIADMSWVNASRLRSVRLPDSLRYIGTEAFHGASITSIELPDNLLHISWAAFRGAHLLEIVVPESVIQVEQWVFMDCEKIQRIIVKGKNTEIIWPAITGRKDKKPIEICAPSGSSAEEYCLKYAKKYNLIHKKVCNR